MKDILIKDTLKPVKKKVIIGIVLCVGLSCIFIADDWQQRRFAILEQGYYYMEQCQYDEAVASFEKYLNMDSPIYWYFMEHMNDESYSRKNVSDCLEECISLQAKIC